MDKKNVKAFYRNGNYHVMIMSDGTKIRQTDDNEFIPAFAENCDVKITGCCDGGCEYCYEGCTPKGKHGDIMNYKFLDTLHPYTELAINGNDLSHPDLYPFLILLKNKKIITNMTVNQKHFMQHYDEIKSMIDNGLINGLGVSLVEATSEFVEKIKTIPNAVIHVINGIFYTAEYNTLKNNNLKLLVLGYKNLKRGSSYYDNKKYDVIMKQNWLYDNLENIVDSFKVISFDNLALEQLNVRDLMTEEEWEKFYMGNDGTSTFYIDMVKGEFSKNSVAPENKRYPIMDNVDDMFNKIRGK